MAAFTVINAQLSAHQNAFKNTKSALEGFQTTASKLAGTAKILFDQASVRWKP